MGGAQEKLLILEHGGQRRSQSRFRCQSQEPGVEPVPMPAPELELEPVPLPGPEFGPEPDQGPDRNSIRSRIRNHRCRLRRFTAYGYVRPCQTRCALEYMFSEYPSIYPYRESDQNWIESTRGIWLCCLWTPGPWIIALYSTRLYAVQTFNFGEEAKITARMACAFSIPIPACCCPTRARREMGAYGI